MAIYGTTDDTADEQIQLICYAWWIVEDLVVRPSLYWTGVGLGDSNVTESETIILSDTWSKRNLTFSQLKTSHGGRYRCTAYIFIPSIGLYEYNFIIYTSVVKSKR